MTRDTISPPEDQEQIAVFAWIDLHIGRYPELALAFHVPNGGHRNPHVGAHMKRMGVRPGVPDIMLPLVTRQYNGLAIELKRQVGGRVSPEQRQWMAALDRQKWLTAVCRGADDAIDMIEQYLEER